MNKERKNNYYYRRSATGKVVSKHSAIRLPFKKQSENSDSRILLDKDKIKISEVVKSSKAFILKFKPNFKLKFSKRTYFILGIVTVIGLTTISISIFDNGTGELPIGTVTKISNNEQVQSAIVENAKPEYSVLTPDGVGLDTKGGLVKISPDNEKPVYTFKDSLGGSEIVINQQLMPRADGVSSEDLILNMSKQLKATKVIDVGDIKAYLAQADYGPQQIIFNKTNLLIQITSDRKIDDSAWIEYIATLKF